MGRARVWEGRGDPKMGGGGEDLCMCMCVCVCVRMCMCMRMHKCLCAFCLFLPFLKSSSNCTRTSYEAICTRRDAWLQNVFSASWCGECLVVWSGAGWGWGEMGVGRDVGGAGWMRGGIARAHVHARRVHVPRRMQVCVRARRANSRGRALSLSTHGGHMYASSASASAADSPAHSPWHHLPQESHATHTLVAPRVRLSGRAG